MFKQYSLIWILIFHYVDDALYYPNNDKFREEFESALKKRYNLSQMANGKWYWGMEIKQTPKHFTLNQEQYVKILSVDLRKASHISSK